MFRVHTVILYKRRKCDKVFSPKSRNVTCGPEAWQSNALTPKTKGRVMTGLMRDLSPSSLVVPPQLNTLPRAPLLAKDINFGAKQFIQILEVLTPTSSWRPFRPLDFGALRPCDSRRWPVPPWTVIVCKPLDKDSELDFSSDILPFNLRAFCLTPLRTPAPSHDRSISSGWRKSENVTLFADKMTPPLSYFCTTKMGVKMSRYF